MKRSHSEADKLGGFDELREEDQDKIRKAWDVGHVADADIPETARKPDDDEHANGSKTKHKEKAVKRAKDHGDDDEPQKKKAKVMVLACCTSGTQQLILECPELHRMLWATTR